MGAQPKQDEYLTNSLFRREVARNEARDVYGSVSIGLPRWWTSLLVLLLAGLIIAAIFLAFQSYTRFAIARGYISYRSGAPVVHSRTAGVISLYVVEGQKVFRGEPLFTVREETAARGETSVLQQALTTLDTEAATLDAQRIQLREAAHEADTMLTAQLTGLGSDLEGLDEQIALQRRLVDGARDQLDGLDRVEARGFITRRDLAQRRDTVALRQQTLLGLVQTRRSKAAAVTASIASRRQAAADAMQKELALRREVNRLEQRRHDTRLATSSTIGAPVSGTVATVTVQSGQTIRPDTPAMVLAPDDAGLFAILQVPTASIGFVSRGDHVRLAIDAFPYQTFGSVPGRVVTVSEVPAGRTEGAGGQPAAYRVVVALDRAYVDAYGTRRPLKAGMTLSARIVLGRETFFAWLFRPVFAVRNR